jgi:hypothetical protein
MKCPGFIITHNICFQGKYGQLGLKYFLFFFQTISIKLLEGKFREKIFMHL